MTPVCEIRAADGHGHTVKCRQSATVRAEARRHAYGRAQHYTWLCDDHAAVRRAWYSAHHPATPLVLTPVEAILGWPNPEDRD